MFCGEDVEDYEPVYCCDGYMCGCQGMPIDPPMHTSCVVIDYLKKLKNFCNVNKDISIGMCRSYPGQEVKLQNHRKVISSEDITVKESQYVMDCQGYAQGLADMADHIIEQLGGSSIEEPSKEHPKKISNRWEILDFTV
jgi:hypothetical protein